MQQATSVMTCLQQKEYQSGGMSPAVSVKSTLLKAIKVGNCKGWRVMNERTMAKYHPETTETPTEHFNQTQTKKCKIDQEQKQESMQCDNSRLVQMMLIVIKGKENQRRLHQRVWCERDCVLWPDWTIPNEVAVKEYIYHDMVEIGRNAILVGLRKKIGRVLSWGERTRQRRSD